MLNSNIFIAFYLAHSNKCIIFVSTKTNNTT